MSLFSDFTSLAVPRARHARTDALLAALHVRPDVRGVEVRAQVKADGADLIVVELASDSVPTRNVPGIRYPEPLALWVPASEREPVQVFATRADFPALPHTFRVAPEGPSWLCLYSDPADIVAVGWTPERLVERIKWWLGAAACGTLDPPDGPMEPPFLIPRSQLVLPALWQPGTQAVWPIDTANTRPDASYTAILGLAPRRHEERATVVIAVTAEAVVDEGFIALPPDLGTLADWLEGHGTALIPAMGQAIQSWVGTEGRPRARDTGSTCLLLALTLRRGSNDTEGQLAYYGWALSTGVLRLGLELGALVKHEGTCFIDHLGEVAPAAERWRAHPLSALEVLALPDAGIARRYAGIAQPGPRGVLVGVGALGSLLAEIWTRSGWGDWFLIDPDMLRPHNLVRHVGLREDIGRPKAELVGERLARILPTADPHSWQVADVLSLTDTELASVTQGKDLVVDVTTTLSYARRAGRERALPRHVSLFLTPTATGAVLMAEDAQRTLPLTTLEAQYYRAMLQAPWGIDFVGTTSGVRTGRGCNDRSATFAVDRVALFAGLLAEQVRLAASQDGATIATWSWARGELRRHAIRPYLPIAASCGDWTLLMDEGLFATLQRLRERALPNETGGVLLGYHDFVQQTITVAAALRAPHDSMQERDAFQRGTRRLESQLADSARRTGGIVGYVADWHSHPDACGVGPSAADAHQLSGLAASMRREGLPALQLIVGDDSKWSIRLRQGDKVYSDEGRTPTDRVPPSSRLDNRPLRKKLVVAR